MARWARRSVPIGLVAWIALVGGCGGPEAAAPLEDAIEVEAPLRVEVPIDAALDDGECGVALWLPATMRDEAGWSRPHRWLTRHQSRDGSWSSYAFGSWCAGAPCSGASVEDETVGVTGLVLMAYFCIGETHKSGDHGVVIRRGLEFLKSVQGPDGSFARPWNSHPGLQNAWAGAGTVEAYGLTLSKLVHEPAERIARFLQSTQLPCGGWRKEARGEEADLETTVWTLLALRSAQLCDLGVDRVVFVRAIRWLDTITDHESGSVGTDRRLEAETAMATVARRICLGALKLVADARYESASEVVSRHPPVWDPASGAMDMRSWYFGTCCCFIRAVVRPEKQSPWTDRSDRWAAGLLAMQGQYLPKDMGCTRDSYDPCEPWGREHGRVASTAMAAILTSFWF